MCPRKKVLGRCVPRTMRPLDNADNAPWSMGPDHQRNLIAQSLRPVISIIKTCQLILYSLFFIFGGLISSSEAAMGRVAPLLACLCAQKDGCAQRTGVRAPPNPLVYKELYDLLSLLEVRFAEWRRIWIPFFMTVCKYSRRVERNESVFLLYSIDGTEQEFVKSLFM
jgi:hypothetical protein